MTHTVKISRPGGPVPIYYEIYAIHPAHKVGFITVIDYCTVLCNCTVVVVASHGSRFQCPGLDAVFIVSPSKPSYSSRKMEYKSERNVLG